MFLVPKLAQAGVSALKNVNLELVQQTKKAILFAHKHQFVLQTILLVQIIVNIVHIFIDIMDHIHAGSALMLAIVIAVHNRVILGHVLQLKIAQDVLVVNLIILPIHATELNNNVI